MRSDDHLTDSLLIRAIDDELPEPEAAVMASHLSACEECQQTYDRLALLSRELEFVVTGTSVNVSRQERESLNRKLEPRERKIVAARSPEKVLQRFGWGTAIAATLAIGVILAPRAKNIIGSTHPSLTASQNTATFSVDGEAFVPVPFSNSSLPLGAPHIVQMRVPVSSLLAAGVNFGPISSEVARNDASVVTDVLLGMDGQPLGVHVTGTE